MKIESTATKWALLLAGFFVIATISSLLLPIAIKPFAANALFDNSTCGLWNTTTEVCDVDTGVGCSDIPTNVTGIIDNNCVTNSFTSLNGAVATMLIIVFVISLILLAIGALKYSKHR